MPPGPVLRFGGALAWLSVAEELDDFVPFAAFVPFALDLLAGFEDGSGAACGDSAAGSGSAVAALADGGGAVVATADGVAAIVGAAEAAADGSGLTAVFASCLPRPSTATSRTSKSATAPAV